MPVRRAARHAAKLLVAGTPVTRRVIAKLPPVEPPARNEKRSAMRKRRDRGLQVASVIEARGIKKLLVVRFERRFRFAQQACAPDSAKIDADPHCAFRGKTRQENPRLEKRPRGMHPEPDRTCRGGHTDG